MSPLTADYWDKKADLIEQRSVQLVACLEKKHPQKMQHLDNLLNHIGWDHSRNRIQDIAADRLMAPTPPQGRPSSRSRPSSSASSQCSTRCSSVDGNPQSKNVHLRQPQDSIEVHPSRPQSSADGHQHQTHFWQDAPREEFEEWNDRYVHLRQPQSSADGRPHRTPFWQDEYREEFEDWNNTPYLVTLPNLKADCFAERRRLLYTPLNTKSKPAWSDDFARLPVTVDNCRGKRRSKSLHHSARGHSCLHDRDRKLQMPLPRQTPPNEDSAMAKLPRKMCSDRVQDLAVDAPQKMTTSGENTTHAHVRSLSARAHTQQTFEGTRDQLAKATVLHGLAKGQVHHLTPTPPQSRSPSATRPHSSQSQKSEGAKLSEDKSVDIQKPIPAPPRPRGSNHATRHHKPSSSDASKDLPNLLSQPKDKSEEVRKPLTKPGDPRPSSRLSLRHARAKLREAMPEKETLDMLMKSQHQRLIQDASGAANGFMLIPRVLGEEEHERIREAFSCYDVDGSGSLDTAELRGALADLGYCPQTREEKLQFSKILEDVDREGDGELDIKEFEQAVVRVMEVLRNLQSVELLESFHLHDVDGTGSLCIDEVFDILPELGLAPRIDEEHDMIRQVVAKQDVDHSNEIDFNEFEELLVEVRKRLHRMRRERRRNIIHQCDLDRQIVEVFKNEICELKDQFDCYDRDHSGFLDRGELTLLIADCGLGPKSRAEREEIQALIAASDTDHNAQVTFVEFLQLINGIRRLSSARNREDLQKLFRRFDKDASGSMSIAECSRLLEQFGLSPKTQQEQRHIGVLLEAIDEDGNGSLDFEEFSHLCQRVKEMLQLKVHHEELKAAKSLNITIAQLQEYKAVFEHLDADETGQLSVECVREMVDSVHINVSGDELHEIFTQVDENDSGCIEFIEFLKLISLVHKHAAKHGDMRFRT